MKIPEMTAADCVDEATFKQKWLEIELPDPLMAAVNGGLVADRLSFVFISAYQAAIRDCFPGLDARLWYAFAVSEDRSGVLPGVSVTDGKLSGTKTWVAASDQVDAVIASIGSTVNDGFVCIEANRPGVTVSSRPDVSFLADMSQGAVTFDKVAIEAKDTIGMQGDFGLAEPFFVMAAGAGFVLRESTRRGDDGLRAESAGLLDTLERLSGQGYASSLTDLIAAQEVMTSLGKRCAAISDATKDWEANGRLLGMYGRGLRARVGQASA